MAKHSQTKSWQQPMNCLSVSYHFVELALNGLTNTIKQEYVDVHCRDDELSKSDYKGGFSYNDRKKWKNENEKKQHLPTENAQILPHLSTLIQNNFK